MSVTARGGYQIADFKHIPVKASGEGVTPAKIPGIYEQASNTPKPLLLCNLTLTGEGDTFDIGVMFTNFHNIQYMEEKSKYYVRVNAGDYDLNIFEDDTVEIG